MSVVDLVARQSRVERQLAEVVREIEQRLLDHEATAKLWAQKFDAAIEEIEQHAERADRNRRSASMRARRAEQAANGEAPPLDVNAMSQAELKQHLATRRGGLA